ncbi:MAG TPA: hypothetical protein VE870_07975, partial [Bacteroidales bacterium]|nr:hypothetical protein [Bacteroidales bacterium]
MNRISVIATLLLLAAKLAAQSSQPGMVEFTPDFKFREGFYIVYDQVKNNDPVPPARLITNYDYTASDFYRNILNEKRISFFDVNGARHDIAMNKIWGFSRNGVLYIQVGDGFNRITIVGKICHFVANVTTYDNRYYDPYNYYPYSSPYSMSPGSYKNSETRQYLMDFETGKLYDYDVNSVEILLMKDAELYDEYMGLRKRKKKQLKFFYIRKF